MIKWFISFIQSFFTILKNLLKIKLEFKSLYLKILENDYLCLFSEGYYRNVLIKT